MEKVRGSFQGIGNIVRFNWHFYVLAIAFILALLMADLYVESSFSIFVYLFCVLIFVTIIVSLIISHYVYDLSNLYDLTWLGTSSQPDTVVNIHAGFDETSELLKGKFPNCKLHVFDFYDPSKHTEVSIKRARRAYPPYPETRQIKTSEIPLGSRSVDAVFLILAAHEIRNEIERVLFFKELHRVLTENGQILVVEHLRNSPNFLAYTVGFFHFHSYSTWKRTFKRAELNVLKEGTITPFLRIFTLSKNGISS